MKIASLCSHCGGDLKRGGWMRLQCQGCGAKFDVFPDGSLEPFPNDPANPRRANAENPQTETDRPEERQKQND